jgi:hypothetical protein
MSMKLVNVSKQPFEFTYDSIHVVMQPGDVLEVEDWVGERALRQSVILDTTYGDPDGTGEGVPTGEARLRRADQLDRDQLRQVRRYVCPEAQTGHCSARPFGTMDELRAHLEVHLSEDAADLLDEPVAAAPSQPKRK